VLPRFLAFFSLRFSLSDFCATFFWSFFGLSEPFMCPSCRDFGVKERDGLQAVP